MKTNWLNHFFLVLPAYKLGVGEKNKSEDHKEHRNITMVKVTKLNHVTHWDWYSFFGDVDLFFYYILCNLSILVASQKKIL